MLDAAAFAGHHLPRMHARLLPILACLAFASLAGAAPPVLGIIRDGRGRTLAVKNTAARAPQETFFASLLASPAAAPAPADTIASAGAVLAPLASHFGVASADLLPQGAAMDALRMNHVHYVQQHHGVPVFGSEIIVHLNPDGEFSTVNGRMIELQDGDVATVPAINATRAYLAARNIAILRPDYMLVGAVQTAAPPKLWIYNEGFVTNSGKSESHLVWEVALFAGDHASDTFYIEAIQPPRLLKEISGFQELNRKIFDCGDDRGDTTCYFNLFTSQYNYYFGRSEGYPVRGPNPVPGPFFGSTDVDTLYDYVPFIMQYYQDKFGRNGGNAHGGSTDGINFPYGDTRIFAHVDASASGNSCSLGNVIGGAWYSPTSNLNFCVHSASPDIFAHEYGHVVARMKSFNLDGSYHSLLYQSESGALNESNSDLFGEAFEYYRMGGNDWIVGTGSSLFGLRNMADPPSAAHHPPYPDRYLHPDFYRGDTSWDNGAVHVNSSVVNKAAYLAAVGGTFNGRTLTGIGLAKVEQIWYRALTTYYADSETFNGAYVALRQAAADLYPPADVAELTKALQAVEMDLPPLPAPPFVITTVTRLAPAFTASVSWNSHAGKTYSVQYSTDLATWTDLNANVSGQGERTTFTDTVVAPDRQHALLPRTAEVRDATSFRAQRFGLRGLVRALWREAACCRGGVFRGRQVDAICSESPLPRRADKSAAAAKRGQVRALQSLRRKGARVFRSGTIHRPARADVAFAPKLLLCKSREEQSRLPIERTAD